MIELFVIKESEWYELVTESVTLEGERYQAPRSIEASIVIKQEATNITACRKAIPFYLNGKEKNCFAELCSAGCRKNIRLRLKRTTCFSTW